jgi:hypothetical protein
MIASTYLVREGEPLVRIDWVAATEWYRGMPGGMPSPPVSWVYRRPPLANAEAEKEAKLQFGLLSKYPKANRVWTTPRFIAPTR